MKLANKLSFFVFMTLLVAATTAFASTTGLPWESSFSKIQDSMTGPTATIIGTLVILASGIGIAMGEGGGGTKKLLMVVFGLAIAFQAANVITILFVKGSGCMF